MKYPSGETYEGQWKDNKYNGIGKYAWPNGQIYVGDWSNDMGEG